MRMTSIRNVGLVSHKLMRTCHRFAAIRCLSATGRRAFNTRVEAGGWFLRIV